MTGEKTMLRKLRISGTLLIFGLLVEVLSLCWNNAFSFMSFVVAGGLLFASGVILFLYLLVSKTSDG
jgi:hypothetical protein